MLQSCLGGCLARVAFIVLALVVLAVYIHYNGHL